MKIFSWMLVSAASVAAISSIASAQVEVGDTREEVLRNLGEPTGYAETNGVEAYTFDRGRVILRDGHVVSHTLVSQEEAQREQEEAERQREERLEEGRELRDRVTGDRSFRERSARERLAFWQAFRQRYPQVDTGLDHPMAAQQVEMEERQQMREMQMRLMEEEKKAELAQKHAPAQAQQFYGSGWPLVFTDTVHPSAFPDKLHPSADFSRRFGDPHRLAVPVREPRPDPMTGRQRFMPLQEFGQSPAVRQAPQPHHSPHHFRHHSPHSVKKHHGHSSK